SPHDLRVPPLRHAFDLTPAGIQVADHIAHVLLWGRDLDVGHGLEQLDTGTLGGLLDSHGAGDAEGHLGGVDVVVRAVDEDGPDIDERVSGEDPVLEGVGDAGVDRGNVLLGDASAGDLVDELVTAAGAGRLEVDDHMAVLASTARLADVLAFDVLHRAPDRLAVGDLRASDGCLDLELAD